MCLLHLSNNLIKEDINNRRINQNFKVIWDYINKQFQHSIDALNELKLTKTKKFKRHVLNKLARVNYIENEDQYPEQHINRIDFILNIIQTGKVLIRHRRKEIVKKRFLSTVTRRFSNDRNAEFDEESESRSLSDSNQTRSINAISVSFTIDSEESQEENCSIDDEDVNKAMFHPSINSISLYDKILHAYETKCIFFNNRCISIDERNTEIKLFLNEEIERYEKEIIQLKNAKHKYSVIHIPRPSIARSNSSIFSLDRDERQEYDDLLTEIRDSPISFKRNKKKF